MKVVTGIDLAIGDMTADMLERKALPIGLTEFNEWADRIIKAAAVPTDDPEKMHTSQRMILAERMQHLAPTDAFKEDAYFILQLRAIAVKETAFNVFQMIQAEKKQKQMEKLAEATAPNLDVVASGGVLEVKGV